jgi:glycosyltransferase involved in cell wall biosynthesis
MRVCMLLYAFYENDSRVMNYAQALTQRGDSVDIICLKRQHQQEFEVINGVRVYRIQSRVVNEKGIISYFYRLVRFLVYSGITLTKKNARNPYQLVHVHNIPDFEVFAAIVAKWTGSRIILDIHDIVPELFTSKFPDSRLKNLIFKSLLLVEKISIRFSDHVIVANHLWRNKLIFRSVKEDKCTVIMNYPDQTLFFKRPVNKPVNKFILIYPGTLNWHQGLDIAVRAFALIKDNVPEAELHIYGQGSERDALASLISRLGLQNRVLLQDFLPSQKIAEIMANADLGVVPKRDGSFGGEAFSTKTFEFMSLGVPVLVSATRIDRFYFNDSVVKFFTPEDENDLARSMLLLIKDRNLRESLVHNATKYIQEYTWEKKKTTYLDLVDSLVKKQ